MNRSPSGEYIGDLEENPFEKLIASDVKKSAKGSKAKKNFNSYIEKHPLNFQVVEEEIQQRRPAKVLEDDFNATGLSKSKYGEMIQSSSTEVKGSPKNESSGADSGGSTPAVIKGRVTPLSGKVSFQNPLLRKFTASAYAAVTCVNPKIELFDILTMSVLADNPLGQKELESDVVFEFDPEALDLDISTPTRYMLRTVGCTEVYERIVTSFFSDQELSPASTLISKVIKTPLLNTIPTVSAEDMNDAINEIQKNISMDVSVEDAYNDLTSNSDGQDSFNKAFAGSNYDVLAKAAPEISLISIPAGLVEKSSSNFNVSANHWHASYTVAYQWIVNGVTESNSSTYNYTPDANSLMTNVIVLRVGRKNSGDANVDTSLAYHELTYNLVTTDNFTATVPVAALNASVTEPSATPNIQIDLSTGASIGGGRFANCETFSSLAIVENGVPPVAGDFTYTCTSAGTQIIPYSIVNPDGPISIDIWAMDAQGRVSALSENLSLSLDTTDPVINFTNIVASYRANKSHNFSWSLTEGNSSNAQNFSVDFYNGATWVALPNIPVTNGPHTGTVFSSINTLANTYIANAKIRVSYTDLSGRSTTVESSSFSVDRPNLAVAPSTHNYGSVLSKSTGSSQSFTVSNSGTAAGDGCGSVSLGGTNASEFSIITDTCSNNDLATASNCTVVIAPTPNTKGAKSASLDWACGADSISSSLSYNSINNIPSIGASQNINTNEDTALNFTVNSGTDIDGDVLAYSIVSGVSNGVLSGCLASNGDLTCTYTPNTNFNGADSFIYKTNDGNADSSTATVNITVNPINDQPVAPSNYALATSEDVALNFTATAHTDVDLDSLSYSIVTAPTNGTLTNCMAGNSDLTCTYTPNTNYYGIDSFIYKSNDGAVDSSHVTVTITVNSINDAPVIGANQAQTTNEDTVLNFTVNSASDVDLDSLSYSVVTAPSNGTLTNCMSSNGDLTCSYTPNLNFNGVDSITYKTNDGTIDSSNATITITVNPINDQPVAPSNYSLAATEDTILNFTATAHSDVDLDTLNYTIVTAPTNGTLTNCMAANTDLTCTYTPNLNYNGSDSFVYKSNDGTIGSANVVVTITVSPVNDGPVAASNQAVATNEDTVLNFTANSASDVDLDILYYSVVTGPSNGTLSNCMSSDADLTCTYTPNLNFNGVDTFTYRATDGSLNTTNTTVTITVNSLNDTPVAATNMNIATNEDIPLNFTANSASDVDLDSLTYVIVTGPTNGALTNCMSSNGDLTCTYTPNSNYNGSDSFTYKANDGSLDSAITTVSITVNAINDLPVVGSDMNLATNEDTILDFTANAGSDVDLDALTYTIVSAPTKGSISNCMVGTNDLTCRYTPNLNVNGADSFTYRVNDGTANSAGVTTVNITINAVNDAPVIGANQNISVDDNTNVNFTLNNASDVDLDSLSYKVITSPSNGSLSNCITTGSYGTDLTCSYISNVNFHGTDSFTYLAYDGALDSVAVATVTITVTDKTPPAAPSIGLHSNEYTNSTSNSITVSSCTDFAEVLVNEGSQPTSGDASWVSCSTVAGGTSYTLASATEGSHTLKVWTKDANSNVSLTSSNLNVVYDVTLPVLSLATPGLLKGGAALNLAWTVTEINSSSAQNMTLEYYNGSSWVSIGSKALLNGPLSSTAFTYNWTIPSIDSSAVKFRVNYTDLAGNSRTTESGTFTIDSTAPIINIAYTEAYKANIAQNFSWTMSELHASAGDNFTTRYYNGSTWTTLSNVSSGAGPISNQSYSINFNPGGTTLSAQLEVSFTDQAGNSTTATKNLVIDGSTPTLASFDVNQGVAVAENNNIIVEVTGNDASSNITYICMRYDNSTAPTDLSDPCWVTLAAGLRNTNLNIQAVDSLYFRVGFVAKSYDVYAWVADAAGNISVNTNTIGVDKASVIYSPGSPPVVSDLTVANTNTPSNPATLGQLQYSVGADIYVKWRAYDLEGFIANPISIYYTTDDVNYTLLQSGVANAQGSGCTISGAETGCLKLTAAAPTASYFKVRVVAEDTSSAETFLTSVPMNETQFRIIAGNTEKGVGGSGRSVIYRTRSSSHYDDMNSLVVTDKGDIFVRDSDVGLIWVNPATGVANVLIPTTGSSVGDGGPISGAQLNYVQAIVLDHNNGLLVLDSDRIRRIDMNASPWTIDTIIGGGSSSDPGNDVAHNQIKITDYSMKFTAINPLPNGDIYFKSGSYTGTKWRHYKASNKRVYKVEVEGPGMYTDASYSWAGKPLVSLGIAYNTLSSAIEHMQISVRQNVPGNTLNRVARLDFGNGSPSTTYKAIAPFDIAGNVYASYKSGLDGYVYSDSQLRREIFRYDHNTNTFIRIAGTGSYTPTPCADGTVATSCSIYLEGFHVSKSGQVYMNDHGLIRTIDDAGKIVTISGQFPSSGDGSTALSARIAGSHMLNFGKSNASMDTFILGDYISGSYREFNIGGNMNYVTSGYGTTDYVFSVDPATGDILDGSGSSVSRYTRLSSSWSTIVGGGGTWYYDITNADGKIGSDIKFDWYTAQILGYGNGKVMMHKSRWNGSTTSHAYVKLYDVADSYRQSHFAGQDNTDRGSLEAAGINVGTTRVPTYGGLMASQYDATHGWIFKQSSTSRVVSAHANGTLTDYVTLPDTAYGFAMARHGGHEKLYYCASNGRMIEYNKSTATRTELPWGSPTMKCSYGQKKVLYNSVSHSIIFLLHQNGLVGVGEIFL